MVLDLWDFGIIQLIREIFNKESKTTSLKIVYSIANVLVGAFVFLEPKLFIEIFPLLFTIYILLDAIIKTVIYIIYRKNDLPEQFRTLFRVIMSYIFFLIMMFFPLFRFEVTIIIVGIYFIMFAVTYFLDAIDSMVPKSKKNKFKRKFRIVLPVFISAFLPKRALTEINKAFETDDDPDSVKIVKENVEPDIEVFVHMGRKGAASFGHVDLFFEGRVISYGSYDESKVLLASMIGDGVIFETDKEKYISFCNTKVDKTLVGFGLYLTDEQKLAIRNRYEEIKSLTYEWEPMAKTNPAKEYKDYASRLFVETGAKLFKFESSKFKTYFVLNTNCVLLADQLIGASGIDIIKLSGIVTPGTYYDYFNREFSRENSIVVSKNIYLDKTGKLD